MYSTTNKTILKNKKSIERVFILDNKSGICLFEENLSEGESETNISADLASAFISAIANFVDETFSDGIQNIEFRKRKLFFRFTDNLLFIFVFSKSTKIPRREQDRIMNNVIKHFYDRFGDSLRREMFRSHTSNFNKFSEDLTELIGAKLPRENYTNFLRFIQENSQ